METHYFPSFFFLPGNSYQGEMWQVTVSVCIFIGFIDQVVLNYLFIRFPVYKSPLKTTQLTINQFCLSDLPLVYLFIAKLVKNINFQAGPFNGRR